MNIKNNEMMNNNYNKVDVLNPIELFTTVGQELADFISENNYSLDENIISFQELKLKKRLPKKLMLAILDDINQSQLFNYFWDFQNKYKESEKSSKPQFKKSKKIYKSIKRISSLIREGEFYNGIDRLEDLSNFLEIEDEEEINEKVNTNIALYKIPNFNPDSLNLYSWLKRGEIDFRNLNLTHYNKQALLDWVHSKQWLDKINDIDYFLELPNIFKGFGVALIYTPFLPKTVYGAVRWYNGVPLIQISDRDKDLATVWYTLFHEIGHVINHENDEVFEGNINISQRKLAEKEKEANKFAYDHLFNGDGLRKYIFRYNNKKVDLSFIKDTSEQFNTDPILVTFWMKKANVRGVSYRNYLKHIEFSV